MNAILPLSLASLLVLPLRAQESQKDPLPSDARQVVEIYDREVQSLRGKAINRLKSLQDAHTKSGDLEAATAVKNLTALYEAESKKSPGPNAEEATEPGANETKEERLVGLGKVVVNAKAAHRIGDLRKGERITIQYVEGKWAMSGADADPRNWTSPDDHQGGLGLGVYGTDGSGKVVHIVDVPAGTKKRAFKVSFQADYQDVVIRMNDTVLGDNAGFAIYNVEYK